MSPISITKESNDFSNSNHSLDKLQDFSFDQLPPPVITAAVSFFSVLNWAYPTLLYKTIKELFPNQFSINLFKFLLSRCKSSPRILSDEPPQPTSLLTLLPESVISLSTDEDIYVKSCLSSSFSRVSLQKAYDCSNDCTGFEDILEGHRARRSASDMENDIHDSAFMQHELACQRSKATSTEGRRLTAVRSEYKTASLIAANQFLNQEIQRLQEHITKLEDDLRSTSPIVAPSPPSDQLISINQSLVQQIGDLQSHLQSQRLKNIESIDSLVKFSEDQSNCSTLNDTLSNLRIWVDALSSECQEGVLVRTQLNESNSRISILESQCEVLQQSLSDQDSTVSKLNAMITSLQENAETLKKSFEEGQEKIRVKEERNKKMSRAIKIQCEALSGRLKSSRESQNKSREVISRLTQRLLIMEAEKN
eukprot:TRINITY_DN627_c0_g1_i5.p1 TRINITY_DN627_c0_g1~~TRINITY_DN627_c0_g1_i5.p1  ORF type:complete len:477 (+),score=29.35 TRINITY_DN627_c0_g1_i5:168-1433(+)